MRSGSRASVVVVVALGLLLTVAGTTLSAVTQRQQTEERFAALAQRSRLQVEERFIGLQNVASALRDGLHLAGDFDRDDFSALVAASERDGLLDDTQAISFVRVVPTADTAAYQATVQADLAGRPGFPPFRVTPAQSDLADRFVVEYLEPLAGNEAAFGFDIGTDDLRRAAAERARDDGSTAATAPVTLVQEQEHQRAILMLLPVYASGDIPAAAADRRGELVGLLNLIVRIGDLLHNVLGPDPHARFELYDLGPTSASPLDTFAEDRLLYRDGERAISMDGEIDGVYQSLDLDVGGRHWQMVMTPTAAFTGASGAVPLLVAAIGLIATLMLTLVMQVNARARARAEQQVKARTRELRLMIHRAPDATLVVDSRGCITLASDQVESLLGYDPAALIGHPVEDLIPAQLRVSHEGLRSDFIDRAEHARAMAQHREVQALHRDGRAVEVEVNLNPLPPPPDDPSAVQVIASLRDVTARREATRRAEELSEQKTTFLRTISHELRTPLAAIDGFVSILQRLGPTLDDTARADFFRRMRRNTVSLQRLIDEIIEFARMDRDALTVQPESADLACVARDVIEQLDPITSEHEVRLDAPDTCPAWIDVDATTRILTNLLVNATRYSPAGTAVTVRVFDDGVPTLVVEDEGPGIPEHERPHVFERFWRGSGPHVIRQAGTGIGLAVVSELTQLLKGDITLDDSASGGARFTVRLRPPEGADGKTASTPETALPAAPEATRSAP